MARPAQLAGMRFPMSARPVIGLPADRRMLGLHPFHAVGEKYVHAVARAAAALPVDCPVTSVVGHGDSLEDAVQGLDFADSEIVMIGSSRMAQPKRLFLGHSASKIMRALPVPMIVWPRG